MDAPSDVELFGPSSNVKAITLPSAFVAVPVYADVGADVGFDVGALVVVCVSDAVVSTDEVVLSV